MYSKGGLQVKQTFLRSDSLGGSTVNNCWGRVSL